MMLNLKGLIITQKVEKQSVSLQMLEDKVILKNGNGVIEFTNEQFTQFAETVSSIKYNLPKKPSID